MFAIFSETESSYQFLHTFSGKEIRDLLVASNGRYDFARKCVVFPSIDECRNEVLVLNPYDQNLLFKRLRKLIAEKYDEKICYYLVSEYGGRTYRPHWHGNGTNQLDDYWNQRYCHKRTSPVGGYYR